MEEARTEPEAGGHVAGSRTARLMLVAAVMCLVALEIGEQREVVARLAAAPVGAQVSTQRLVRADRLLERDVVPLVGEQRERAVLGRKGFSRGSAPVFSYASVSFRAATLLASTSG